MYLTDVFTVTVNAAGLPGLALLGWTGLYLFSVRHAVRYIPLKSHPYGAGFEALLFDGVLARRGEVVQGGQHGQTAVPAQPVDELEDLLLMADVEAEREEAVS